jgi:site-specific DNA-methyltransferase (adenine-specific)
VNSVIHGDSLLVLKTLEQESFDLVYADPPFNTGQVQRSSRSDVSYADSRQNFLAWMFDWVDECHRLLKPTGTMYLHLDHHSVHLTRCFAMDPLFGKENFLGEIVWSYNFGGRGKRFFAAKHDNILVYAKEKGRHVFNYDDIDTVPYKAPEMQYVNRSKEEAEVRIAKGQVPTDVWEMSVVGTNAKERTGYPTQKPVKLVKRAIVASSPTKGRVLDPFAGSGTTGAAALSCGREFVLIDENQDAISAMKLRFNGTEVKFS